MSEAKKRIRICNRIRFPVVGIFVLLFLAVLLLCFNQINNTQSLSPMMAQVRFYGDYRIADGPWQPITEGKHISSTKGDVTLRGNFHLLTPNGEYIGIYNGKVPIAIYTNHIGITFYNNRSNAYVLDHENPLHGVSACGVDWTAFNLQSETEEPIEIEIHNPHRFGNENAIDEMLSNFALWSGADFEGDNLKIGRIQRNTGIFFMIVAFALLGSALFSALLHIPNHQVIGLLGATILSAGIYLAYSAPGVSFWSEVIALNTSILGFSMIFYMFFNAGIITIFLKRTKKIGYATTVILGFIDGLCLLLPMLTGVYFYDMWLPWIITQSAANIVLLYCLIKDFVSAGIKERWVHIGMSLLLIAFELDVFAAFTGYWDGGVVSQYVFFALFIAAIFVILRILPESIHAAEAARELELERKRLEAEKSIVEAELKDSRISIMLSQIQPHFIYNTLGTIERMCLKDPEKAFELVRNFSLYLRGNFSELDSVTPIRFAEELNHVEHYVNIEKVRFPDMNIEYDVETTDFVLPALTVQPLVENAIKHGLMRLESGGTVVIHSYETPYHFCVEVKDDGVGFDTNSSVDGKKHVGLRNIQGRLKAMVNGELIIESQAGIGTKAVIMIPKE